MKYLRWLSIGAAVFFCISLSAPLNADAASSQKNQPEKHLVKKSKKQVKEKDKKHIVSKETKKHKKNAPDKEKLKPEKKRIKDVDKERDVWLKRAESSEMLTGKASWYGRDFHKKPTASGMAYDMHTFTAAHRTLPMGTVVRVTDQHNGKSVIVCVTDRGPYVHGRIIDISSAAAEQLDLKHRGVGKVQLEVVSDEKGKPLKSDHAYFVKYKVNNNKSKVGPFNAFADAAAMHEALRKGHPDAVVVLEKKAK